MLGVLIVGMLTQGGATTGTGMLGVTHDGGAIVDGVLITTGLLTGKEGYGPAQPQLPQLAEEPLCDATRAVRRIVRRNFFISIIIYSLKSSNL
jgi:hypothetical protein